MVFHCEILCIILQLHFSRFLKHIFLLTLKIRRLLVRSNYLRKSDTITLRVWSSFSIIFLWYVCIKSWNNVTATFRFRLLLRRNFITYFILFNNFTYFFKWFRFLMTLELRWITEIVETGELCMEVTLWNGKILVTLFFKLTNFLIMLVFLIMLRLRLLCFMFALNMKKMLQSHFIFVQHSGKFFQTS